MVEDAASLPIGAMVLLSDGADNSGGIDLDTISEIRRQRIPVHTIGFGKEKMAHDLEITDVEIAAARSAGIAPGGDSVICINTDTPGQKVKINVKEGTKILASQEITLKGDGVEQSRAGAVQRRTRRREDDSGVRLIRCRTRKTSETTRSCDW